MSPEGFESVTAFSPQKVVDRLSLLLELLVEKAPYDCNLELGGTDQARNDCVKHWRAWGRKQRASHHR